MENKLSGLLSDMPNTWSVIRYTAVLIVTTVIMTWCIMSFQKGQLLPIPDSVIVLVGIAVTGKVSQKYIEDNGGTNDSTDKK